MGLMDSLKSAGFKFQANTDDEFEALVGQYRAVCTALRPEVSKDTGEKNRYYAEWTVQDTLDGTFGNNRKFRKSYWLTNKDGSPNKDDITELLNDFYTCGVQLDTSSDEALEASFDQAIGSEAYIRGWGWTPEKDRQGNLIPEGERKTLQQFVIKKKTNIRVKDATNPNKVPF